jgi:predicted ATPase/Tfp pilus assembly protein PilF
MNELIGRVRELEAVKHALAASRLVTLTGIGGVGKTRLAIRVAEEVADDFPEGVRFVDLSPVADPALVAKTAAGLLGVAEQAGRPLTETVADHLREHHLLLILDNCEHLPEECARFAAALLQQCPGVRILATSRQRLGIAGETVRRVPPLTLPDRKHLSEDEKNAATALLDFEAVRLFVDRAQRVQPNLDRNAPTLRAIADICARLDGIPLALELAAARMSALGPEQIAARLARRLRLLSSGGAGDRTAPARQRTLRGALDWSYDLLSSEERILLGRLSVFAGGWALEAAEAVCAGNGLEEWEVLDCLTALADHSLIVVESENGQARYRLLETMREYGQERLLDRDGDEAAWVRAKHREYFLHLARESVPHLDASDQAEWLDRLEREHDNLRAALDGCLEEGTDEAVQTGLRLAGELRQFWAHRGNAGEGRRRLATLLSRAGPEPTPERGRALEGAGGLAYRQGDYAAARALLEEALAVHRQRGDRDAEAVPLSLLGNVAQSQGDYPAARELLGQALPLHRAAGNRAREAAALSSMGNAAAKQGDLAEAQTLFEEALTISREVGNPAMEGSILNSLGMLAAYQKDLAHARTRFEQSLARNREVGDPVQVVVNLINLANIANDLGDPAGAEEYFRQALVMNRDLGESRNQRLVALLLEGMAAARARSQPERAARLLGAADAQLEAIGVRRTAAADQESYDRVLTDLRAALGDERFSSCWNEGQAMRIDQAVAYAIPAA